MNFGPFFGEETLSRRTKIELLGVVLLIAAACVTAWLLKGN